MKYVAALVIGMLVGVVLLFLGLYFNPLTTKNALSPLSVTDNEVISLNFSAVAQDALVYTNNGDATVKPKPVKVMHLWEPTIRRTSAMVTVLTDSLGEMAGIGIKFSSHSERTSILDGRALIDSAWHIYLPERGSLFVEQSENYWGFLRDIVVPAYWSSGDNWRGTWRGNITAGPGALGTARVVGGSGALGDIETEAVEALAAQAYSVEHGPVAQQGVLTIELPRGEATADATE